MATPLALAGTLGEVMSYDLPSPKFEVITTSTGLHRLQADGLSSGACPGCPALPTKELRFAVPPDADLTTLAVSVSKADLVEVPGEFDIEPSAIPASPDTEWPLAYDKDSGRDPAVYGRAALFPDTCVAQLSYSQMRKWKMARCRFTPFQYNPVSKTLYRVEGCTIEIRFQRETLDAGNKTSSLKAALLHDHIMEREALALLENPREASTWYSRAEAESPVTQSPKSLYADYVIVTTTAIANGAMFLPEFVSHLERQGHSVRIITEAHYGGLSGQSPNGTADKIRQWLKENYAALGIRFVLLLGNPDPIAGDVPMKNCYPNRGGSSDPRDEEKPTDVCYADLTGNWDLNGDGYFGEYNGDRGAGGVDFAPEVLVGRIPVYGTNYAATDLILAKTIAYEATAEVQPWRRRMLLPMAGSYYSYELSADYPYPGDGRDLPKYCVEDFLDRNGFTHWVSYEKEGVSPVPDSAAYDNPAHVGISREALLNQWASGYGCVFWWAHGSSQIAARRIWRGDSSGNGRPS